MRYLYNHKEWYITDRESKGGISIPKVPDSLRPSIGISPLAGGSLQANNPYPRVQHLHRCGKPMVSLGH